MTHNLNLFELCGVTAKYFRISPKVSIELKKKERNVVMESSPSSSLLPIKLLKIVIPKFETPRVCEHSETEVYVQLAIHMLGKKVYFHSMSLNFDCASKTSRLLFTDWINIDFRFHLHIFWVRKLKRSWKINLCKNYVEDADAQFGEPVVKHGLWCDPQLSPVSVRFWVWIKSWSFTCMDLNTNSKEWEQVAWALTRKVTNYATTTFADQ